MSMRLLCILAWTRPPNQAHGLDKEMPPTDDYFRGHPLAKISGSPHHASHETLLVGVFGIPGVVAGKAGSRVKQSPAAAAEAAANHAQHVVSAFARHPQTRVHAAIHAWEDPLSEMARVLNASYGNYLFASRFDSHGRKDHVLGQIDSMAAVLSLLDAAPRREHTSPLAVLMRHDTWWFDDLELRQLVLGNETIVTGAWCAPPRDIHSSPDHCGPLESSGLEGIHDFFFIGEIQALQRFVSSLQTRIARHGNENPRAHFEFDIHAQRLGLKQRGLWQSHPSAISYVTYTLYRWRAVRLHIRNASSLPSKSCPCSSNKTRSAVVCYDPKAYQQVQKVVRTGGGVPPF